MKSKSDYRSTDFVESPNSTSPDVKVLFVKVAEGNLSLANISDITRLAQKAYEEGLHDGQKLNKSIKTTGADGYRRGYVAGYSARRRSNKK